jgi:hypothetical protein
MAVSMTGVVVSAPATARTTIPTSGVAAIAVAAVTGVVAAVTGVVAAVTGVVATVTGVVAAMPVGMPAVAGIVAAMPVGMPTVTVRMPAMGRMVMVPSTGYARRGKERDESKYEGGFHRTIQWFGLGCSAAAVGMKSPTGMRGENSNNVKILRVTASAMACPLLLARHFGLMFHQIARTSECIFAPGCRTTRLTAARSIP